MLDDIMGELQDEDDAQTGKRGLTLLHGPADPDGSNADETSRPKPGDADPGKPKGGDKLAELVASLSPEEKAKLRALLDADEAHGAAPAGGVVPKEA